MIKKISRIVIILVAGLLMGACAGVYKKPVLQEWPAYVPSNQVAVNLTGLQPPPEGSCAVHALDLIGAWVTAGTPETDPFSFTSLDGKDCQGTFEADVRPLFTTSNRWFPGAPSCRTCHGPDVTISYVQMDLSSYQGIKSGMARESASAQGQDILGGGDWGNAVLNKVLAGRQMPPNTPAGLDPRGPVVYAGTAH